MRDVIIALIYGSYMEEFNFRIKGKGVALTLSSLASNDLMNSLFHFAWLVVFGLLFIFAAFFLIHLVLLLII